MKAFGTGWRIRLKERLTGRGFKVGAKARSAEPAAHGKLRGLLYLFVAGLFIER